MPHPEAPPASARPRPARPRGRPRVTPEQLRERLAAYCDRYDVRPARDGGLPPFPAGRRESAQHREWMALYKARRRLATRRDPLDLQRIQDRLSAQQGLCVVCRRPLELADALVDDGGRPHAAVLHSACHWLVDLMRLLGADAVDRARQRL